MLESLFNKAYEFIEKRLQHRFFPVNISKLLRTAFYRILLTAVSVYCRLLLFLLLLAR